MACHAPTDTASTAATAAGSDGMAPTPATAAAAALALALVPAGGAGGSGGGGAAFRIGSEYHGYVYTETPNMRDPWHDAPVYRCSRDVNLQRHDRALFCTKVAAVTGWPSLRLPMVTTQSLTGSLSSARSRSWSTPLWQAPTVGSSGTQCQAPGSGTCGLRPRSCRSHDQPMAVIDRRRFIDMSLS